MSRFLPFILLHACFLPADAAGKQGQTDWISEKLTGSGFENVRVSRLGDTLSVSIEFVLQNTLLSQIYETSIRPILFTQEHNYHGEFHALDGLVEIRLQIRKLQVNKLKK